LLPKVSNPIVSDQWLRTHGDPATKLNGSARQIRGAPIAVVVAASLSVVLLLGNAARIAALAFEAPYTCVVIRDEATGTVWRSDPSSCATRLSPASTFKIAHALVALETGVVTPTMVEQWDGTRHQGLPKWDTNHTVESALKPSVVWFFQRIAPRIGAARMRDWLERLRYGNARTDGDVSMYWLNGTLQISPDEQVGFLHEFYTERLPVRPEWQRLIRGALDQPPATIEYSGGVAPLGGKWPAETIWNAKTGRTAYGGRTVSWLVGSLVVRGRGHVFSAAVWHDTEPIASLDAARLAVKVFVDRGILQPGAAP
jgi:beta-lactamase class D